MSDELFKAREQAKQLMSHFYREFSDEGQNEAYFRIYGHAFSICKKRGDEVFNFLHVEEIDQATLEQCEIIDQAYQDTFYSGWKRFHKSLNPEKDVA